MKPYNSICTLLKICGGLDYYWKSPKPHAFCPQIVQVILPGIDSLVEEYDRQRNLPINSYLLSGNLVHF